MPMYKAVEDIAVGDRLVEGAGGIAWLVTSTEATAKTVTLAKAGLGRYVFDPQTGRARFEYGRGG